MTVNRVTATSKTLMILSFESSETGATRIFQDHLINPEINPGNKSRPPRKSSLLNPDPVKSRN